MTAIRLPSHVARRLGHPSERRPRVKGQRCLVTTLTVTLRRGRRLAVRALAADELASLLVWACCGVWP